MKTANGVEKPLAEWTLKDMKCFCKIQCENKKCTPGCPLHNICNVIPNKWVLEEKPKFTKQDIADAKTLTRLLSASRIKRGEENALYVCIADAYFLRISDTAFQSIKNGEIYKIGEIIGDSDA